MEKKPSEAEEVQQQQQVHDVADEWHCTFFCRFNFYVSAVMQLAEDG